MSQLNVTSLKHESASGDNITLDSNGNVGIGTAAPAKKLHVNGDIRLGDGGGTGAVFTDATNGLRFMLPASGTSNTEAMRIDSAGRVTMPYQPAFAVYKNGSQATNTPAAQLTGWSESFNTGGHFSTATSRFTAPLSGKYLLNYTGLHHSGGVSTGYWVRVYLTINGATVVDGLGDNGTYGNYQRLSLSQVLSLNAGDYVTLLVESSVASSTGVYAGYTHWSGFLIG